MQSNIDSKVGNKEGNFSILDGLLLPTVNKVPGCGHHGEHSRSGKGTSNQKNNSPIQYQKLFGEHQMIIENMCP